MTFLQAEMTLTVFPWRYRCRILVLLRITFSTHSQRINSKSQMALLLELVFVSFVWRQHETSFKNWLCPNISCCSKNLSCPKFCNGLAASPAPKVPTPIHRMQIWRTTRSMPGKSCMKARLVRLRYFVLIMLSFKSLAYSLIWCVSFRCSYELLCFWMPREVIEVFTVFLYRVRNCDSLVANATKYWVLATRILKLVASRRLTFCPLSIWNSKVKGLF